MTTGAGPVDLVLRGGLIVDGTGSGAVAGDAAIAAGRIVAAGAGVHAHAREVIDVGGLVVAPGFIDLHVHADLAILADRGWGCEVAQGVTSIVVGQDGLGLAPLNRLARANRRELRGINGDPAVTDWRWSGLGGYLDRVGAGGTGPNVAAMASHGTIRLVAIGDEQRAPSEAALSTMRRLAVQSMKSGAFGLSAGLTYAPASFADDDELVALCEAIRPFGGFYQPHHRNYGAGALREYATSIDIGRRAGVPVHLTHAHLSFPVNRGRARELLDLVDASIAAGLDVTLDSYPYLAGSTYLAAFLPSWAQAGGPAAILARLRSAEVCRRIEAEMEAGCDGLQGIPVDWYTMSIAGVDAPALAWAVGRTLVDVAARLDVAPFEAFRHVVVEDRARTLGILTIGHEANVRAILAHPSQMPASDGIVVGQRPHPRAWGTFARCLGRYVREQGLVPLEEMVRKMTSAPARRLGLTDRGLIRAGFAADIVALDPATVIDLATYEDPRRHPEGIPLVLVNGVVVKRDGTLLPALPGRVLRRGDRPARNIGPTA